MFFVSFFVYSFGASLNWWEVACLRVSSLTMVIKSPLFLLVIFLRMRAKTMRDQETRRTTERTRSTMWKRIMKRRKRRWRRTRLVMTREPIGGRRCRTDPSFEPAAVPFRLLVEPIRSSLLFLKGIKAAIHSEFQLGKLGYYAWKMGCFPNTVGLELIS